MSLSGSTRVADDGARHAGDVEELEICSGKAQDYEPLAYVAYLIFGVVAGLHSLLWVLHVVLYVLVDPPATSDVT